MSELVVSEPGEIAFEREFYDYEAKYTPGGMELLVPARISAAAREQLAGARTRAPFAPPAAPASRAPTSSSTASRCCSTS